MSQGRRLHDIAEAHYFLTATWSIGLGQYVVSFFYHLNAIYRAMHLSDFQITNLRYNFCANIDHGVVGIIENDWCKAKE